MIAFQWGFCLNLGDNDVKYVRGSIGKMSAFKREKYTVTNTSGIELYYSNYLIYEDNITHQIIITGPKKMQKELDTMMDDIVNSIKMANQQICFFYVKIQ